MAQLIVSMNLSMDGYIEAQGQDDGSWLRIDEAVHRAFNELAASAEAFLYRRKVYEVMIPYLAGRRRRYDQARPRTRLRADLGPQTQGGGRSDGRLYRCLTRERGGPRPERLAGASQHGRASAGDVAWIDFQGSRLDPDAVGFFRTLMSIELTKDAGRDDMIRQVTALEKKLLGLAPNR